MWTALRTACGKRSTAWPPLSSPEVEVLANNLEELKQATKATYPKDPKGKEAKLAESFSQVVKKTGEVLKGLKKELAAQKKWEAEHE